MEIDSDELLCMFGAHISFPTFILKEKIDSSTADLDTSIDSRTTDEFGSKSNFGENTKSNLNQEQNQIKQLDNSSSITINAGLQSSPKPSTSSSITINAALQSSPNLSTSSSITNNIVVNNKSLPWAKFPQVFLDACRDNEVITSKTLEKVVHILSDYQRLTLKDSSKDRSKQIAKCLIDAHPDVFSLKIGDSLINNGLTMLSLKLYNNVRYENKLEIAKGSVAKKRKLEEEKEEPDEYGFVGYKLKLGKDETIDTQKTKKNWLRTDIKNCKNKTYIRKLFSETFPSQRHDIINRAFASACFVEWPILKTIEYYFEHANMLLGKGVREVFRENTEAYNLVILNYFENYANKRTKNQSKEITEKKEKSFCLTIENCKQKSLNHGTIFPNVIGILKILSLYFDEPLENILKFHEVCIKSLYFFNNQLFNIMRCKNCKIC